MTEELHDVGIGIPRFGDAYVRSVYQWFHKDCFLGGLLGIKVPDA